MTFFGPASLLLVSVGAAPLDAATILVRAGEDAPRLEQPAEAGAPALLPRFVGGVDAPAEATQPVAGTASPSLAPPFEAVGPRAATRSPAAPPPLRLGAERLAWLQRALGTDQLRLTAPGGGYNSAGSCVVEAPQGRFFYKQVPTKGGAGAQAQVLANNLAAEGLGFGPQVVAVDHERGALLLAFLEGELGSSSPEAMARFRLPVLQVLRELHASTATSEPFAGDQTGHHARCNDLHLRAAAVADADALALARAATLCHAASARLGELVRPTSRLHNDPNPRNQVMAHGVAQLIDWDALGWGDPMQDVALYALEHGIGAEGLPQLLVDYQGDALGLERLQLYLARYHAQRYFTLCIGMPWDEAELRPQYLAEYAQHVLDDNAALTAEPAGDDQDA